MKEDWEELKSQWILETGISPEAAQWASNKSDRVWSESTKTQVNRGVNENSGIKPNEGIEKFKKEARANLISKEKSLDTLSASSPSSYKLQVSVPININYLMKAWAAAEGRDLSSVALQCLEMGLRENKSKGSIPNAAIKLYEIACEKRIAIAELNHKLEQLNVRSKEEE